jgi:porin
MISSQRPMRRGLLAWLLLGAGCVAFSGNLAHAQDAVGNAPAPETVQLPPNLPPTIGSSIPVLAQFKKGLLDLGYNLQLNYTGDVLGNPTGGVKQGATYEGLLEMALDGDLDKIAGLNGATFHINAFEIHGRGLATFNIGNSVMSRINSFEARHAIRLFEAWAEQQLFQGLAAIRIGQLSADTEFIISDLAALYLNGTFGWPDIMVPDLPSAGGPNYPLATPGVRLKATPTDQITLLAALFNGDPSGARLSGLAEIKDPAGINFRLKDPPFLISEAQFKYNQASGSAALAGTIRLGGWHHFGGFSDERFGIGGLPLANPASGGIGFVHHGNSGLYGIIDQMIWRLPGEDPKKGVGVFARAMAAPSDRNLIDLYADAGVNFIGLWDRRPDDTFGMAAAYSRISPAASGSDADAAFFTSPPLPVRDDQVTFELTYQAQIAPGFLVQPDFQYIFHPAGGAVNPVNPASGRIPDAAVFSLRTAIKF